MTDESMAAQASTADPLVRQFREQISDLDRSIVETVNARLKLVERLWRYKESRGFPVVDPSREEWMLRFLNRANRGPLSEEGLEELFTFVLELTRREVGQREADARR